MTESSLCEGVIFSTPPLSKGISRSKMLCSVKPRDKICQVKPHLMTNNASMTPPSGISWDDAPGHLTDCTCRLPTDLHGWRPDAEETLRLTHPTVWRFSLSNPTQQSVKFPSALPASPLLTLSLTPGVTDNYVLAIALPFFNRASR